MRRSAVTCGPRPSPGCSPGPHRLREPASDWGFKLQHLAATELWLQVQRDPGFFERTAPELDPVRYEIAVTGA